MAVITWREFDAWAPAHGAASLDPMRVLREE